MKFQFNQTVEQQDNTQDSKLFEDITKISGKVKEIYV